MSRKNALKPLKNRLNDYQQGRRATRIAARKTIAESLAMFVFAQTAPFRLGFFGRLRWLLTGGGVPKLPQVRMRDTREKHS